MAVQTSDILSPRTKTFLAKKFLDVMVPYLMLMNFAQSDVIPKGNTKNITWRRYNPLPTIPKALVEGVTPAAGKLTYDDIQATITQYGDVMEISDVVQDTNTDPVLQQITERMGESAAEMLERVAVAKVLGGTNVYYANGASRSAVNTRVSRDLFRKCVKALKRARCRPVTRVLTSDARYGTVNVKPSFICFHHPDLTADIRDCDGFKAVEDYGRVSPYEREIGTIEEVRFIEEDIFTPYEDAGGAAGTSLATTGGTYANVYPLLLFGKDFFGAVALKGYRIQNSNEKGEPVVPVDVKVINPDTISKSDPLGQRGYAGWKTYFTAEILQEMWGMRLEAAGSN